MVGRSRVTNACPWWHQGESSGIADFAMRPAGVVAVAAWAHPSSVVTEVRHRASPLPHRDLARRRIGTGGAGADPAVQHRPTIICDVSRESEVHRTGWMCGARGDSPRPRVYRRIPCRVRARSSRWWSGRARVHQSAARDVDRMQFPRVVGERGGSWPRSAASREW